MNRMKEVWVLQVVEYLIKNHSYSIVNVVTDGTKKENEVWLLNKYKRKYPIIRVTSDTNNPSDLDIQRLAIINDHLAKIINNYKDVLNIYVENSKVILDDKALVTFKNIEDKVFDVGDVDLELKRLTSSINSLGKRKSLSNKLLAYPFVTLATIFLACLMYFVAVYFQKDFNSYIESAIFFGAYYKTFIRAKEVFRFISVGLTHASYLHLLMNMMALYYLGTSLELLYGHLKFFLILLGSIFGGSLFLYLFDSTLVATGISGGVYGLMGAFIVHLYYTGQFKNPYTRNNILRNLFMNLMISFMPNVALFAHLGGFIFGVLLGIIFISNKNLKLMRINAGISLMALLLLGLYRSTSIKQNEYYPASDIKIVENIYKWGFGSYADRLMENLEGVYREN